MLNKEKFAKEIIEIATNGNFTHGNFKEIAVVDGKPCRCENTNCRDCDFNIITCDNELSEWANSEYKELVIDWDKVPVDTPVLVWDYDDRCKKKRYYAGTNGTKFMSFTSGATSWSSDSGKNITPWFNCELARKEDIKKYRKR
ncbi:hypothetical protein DW954_02620 [Clostridium sp. AM45-5]|nr:hypothetical protein [Clostridium sp. AM45-5]RHS68248.1 hypothetical protein DW954_02620 [Clostridium sp. AM45-5]